MLLQFTDVVETAVNKTIAEVVGKQYRVVNTGAVNVTVTFGANTAILAAGTYGDFWFDGTDWNYSVPNGLAASFNDNAATGWIPDTYTWTYASAATFSITGDHRGRINKGDKLRWTQGGTVKYGYVRSVAYGGVTTVVTIIVNTDYVMANAQITAPAISKVASPVGFPSYFNYTPTVSGETGTGMTYTVTTARFTIAEQAFIAESNILVTAKGTSGGGMLVTTPVLAAGTAGAVMGREDALVGWGVIGKVVDANSYYAVFKYDGTTCITLNYRILSKAIFNFV